MWKWRRAGGPLGGLTCVWEGGVYLGIEATTGEVIVENRNGVWTRTVQRKTARERWERSNLEMIVAVPWRKNEDGAEVDGERLEKRWRWKNMFPYRRECTRENLEVFWFTARCAGCTSLLKETARQAHTENCQKRIEEELRGTAQAEAAQKAREGTSGQSSREENETWMQWDWRRWK